MTSPHPLREAPIEMSPDAFRAAGHRLVDRVADFFARLPAGPVTRDASPQALRASLGGDDGLPERGADPLELLESAAELLFEHSLFNGHPRFLGYITAAPAPIGILGDFLASAINANVGAWRLSPMASEIEAQAIRWLAELVGLPASTGGLMVSGGSMANTVALLVARRAACDWDVRRMGALSPAGSALRVYASDATHTWIRKAVELTGLGTDSIRWVPTDDRERMVVAALTDQIEHDRREGDVPIMVVATAGTVSTGAVDPLFEIADVCARAGIWMHVDGCYGGVAACVPGTPHDLVALRRADSVALDPHKWLYAPLEAGAVLVRDPQRLRDAFAYHPPYYHFGAETLNYFDLGPQNSRGFRGLKVWLALRQVGRDGYVQMIGDDIRLSQRIAAVVDAHDELELFTRNLSTTTFRFVPRDLGRCRQTDDGVDAYLDEVNEALVDELQRSGEVFVSHAIVNGRYALRSCIVNFRTDVSDVDALLRTVVHRGRAIDASSRARLMDPSR